MTTELTPIDVATIPGLAPLVEEVRTTGKRRRITHGDRDVAVLTPAPAATPRRRPATRVSVPDEADPVIAELERRRRLGLGVADMTAGILKYAAKMPPPAPREEKDAFEQAVVDEVMASMKE